MPVGAVKTRRDERLWEEAKRIAAEEGKGGNYAYIMGIYERMKKRQGGAKKRKG